MAEFMTKFSGMRRASRSEEEISRELDRIAQEIQEVLSNLQVNSPSIGRVKSALRADRQNVSTLKRRVQILSDALEEITKLYEDTENRILGDSSGGNSTKQRIRELSEKVREQQKSLGMDPGSSYSRDPVNLCNGNYVYEKMCLELDTVMPLQFRIFYNMQNEESGSLGRGWTHTYELKLILEEDQVSVQKDDASRMIFVKDEERFHPASGTFGELTRTERGYLLVDKDQFSYSFDADGVLLEKKDMLGNWIRLDYNSDGRLQKVEDRYHNYLEFVCSPDGLLEKVTDHTGRAVCIICKDGLLSEIKDAQGRTVCYRYDEHGWLTGLVNARGLEGLRNEFDEAGRTVRQEFPDGGVITYDYTDGQVCMTEQNGNRIIYEHDHLFRNTRNIYENGEEVFTFNDNHQRTSFTDRNGNTTCYEYDEKGNLSAFRSPLNDEVTLEYTKYNQISAVKLNGQVLHRAYYNDRNLQEAVENAAGGKQRFEYDLSGQPVTWIREDGSRVELTYDQYGNMTSITNAAGGKTVYEYDERRRVIRTVDGMGNATEYVYNDADEIILVKNANGDIRTYEYDPCGNLTRMTDFNGAVTELEYNCMNKPVRITNPDGDTTMIEYDQMWNMVRQTLPDGGVFTYEYDKMQNLTRVTDAGGAVNEMEYDACGNMIKRTAPDGGIHQLFYDGLNRPERVIDPCGQETAAKYDALGNVTEVLYADGLTERYTYDLLGNMTSSEDRSGYRKEYAYDLLGNLTEVRDHSGVLETYEYYPGGLLKRESYAGGKERSFVYDANENLISAEERNGNIWNFFYDSLGRVICAENNSGIRESYEYDAVGNITAVIDGEGIRTAYQYSPNGALIGVRDGLGNETHYEYDRCQRLKRILQPENGHLDADGLNQFNEGQKQLRITAFQRDAMGNVIRTTDPEGHENLYTYDACGRILSRMDEDGNLTACSYNPDGTERQYSFADGRTVKLTYNALKQLVQMEDWLGITSIQPDCMGRPEQITAPDGAKLAYGWGERGERRSLTYPDGRTISYVYDQFMRLAECRMDEETVKYQYDPDGRLKEKLFPGGFRTQYDYDTAGRICALCHKKADQILDRYTYRYDRNGRKSAVDRIRNGAGGSGSYAYEYNALGSLISVKKDGQEEESYAYDRFGNRIWSRIRGEEAFYQYDRLNQLVSKRDSQGEHSYTYDGRGNLREEFLNGQSQLKLTFGSLNRLSEFCSKEGRTTNEYNGFGNRVRQTVRDTGGFASENAYFWDILESHRLLGIRNGDSVTDMLWDGEALGKRSSSGTGYFMNDELMSPLRMIERNQISVSMQYDCFGNLLERVGSGAGTPGFTGYQPEGEGGLYHAGAREYTPENGRFISRDINPGILITPLSLNLYSYCMGDPINYHDPTGRIAAWLAGGIVGAVTNVVTKAAGDVVNSVKSGKVQVSSWQSYVGTAAGGFTTGTVFVATGSYTAASAAGAAVETFTSEGLSMVTGADGYRREDGYSWKNLAGNTAVSAAKGAVAGAAGGYIFKEAAKYIKIPGITSGRGSFQAVWKQVMTKAARGQIANVTMKTVYKGLTAYGGVHFFDEVLKQGYKGVKEYVKDKGMELLKDLFGGSTPAASANQALDYLIPNRNGARCAAEGTA